MDTNRLSVYTMSWNRSVQNRFFPCIHTRTASFSIHKTRKIPEKVFSSYNCSSKPCPKFSSRANSVKYRQLSSVKFPLASFLRVPEENGSGCLQENFLIRFHAGPTF